MHSNNSGFESGNTHKAKSTETSACRADQSRGEGRRRFLKLAGTAGLTAALQSNPLRGATYHLAPSTESKAESLIGELFEGLSESQRAAVCKPLNDPLRQKVNANWHVVKDNIGSSFYSKSQRNSLHEVVKQLTSRSGFELLTKQTEDDDGGLDAYSVAWFGKPGDAEFEWMLTGRHLTLRADGNTHKKVVFGGPIVYGHGEETSPEDNLFYFQTVKFNKVFESLNADQRSRALLQASIPAESEVRVRGGEPKTGLSAKELATDQLDVLKDALMSVLGVYREEDVNEAQQLIDDAGGLSSLTLQYFANEDLKSDGIWDMWRIVSKNTCIHFRGAPHVHAYIHIQNV